MRVLSWPGPAFAHNPYIRAWCSALEQQGATTVQDFSIRRAWRERWDVIHIHWPERIFWGRQGPAATVLRAGGLLLALAWARLRGAIVVWTAHNLAPHDMRPWQRVVWSAFVAVYVRLIDGYTAFSPATLEIVRDRIRALGDKPGRVIAHGHYRELYPPLIEKQSARQALGIGADEHVMLHLGLLRRYKGTDELLAHFTAMEDPALRLLVAGRPVPAEYAETLQAAASCDSRIRLLLGHQDAATVAQLFSACDLVVLPYAEHLHSGSLLLALSFGRPTLCSDCAFARHVQGLLGPDWLSLQSDVARPETLQTAVHWARTAPRAAAPDLSAFAWEEVGRQTVRFYEELQRRPRAGGLSGAL